MANTLITRTALALVLALPLPVLAQETAPAPAAEHGADTVVARVGDVDITLGHVVMMMSQLPEQYRELPDETLFSGIVDQLVDQELLSREVGPESDFPRAVQLALENERRALLARETITASMAEPVEEAEIVAAYEAAIGSLPTEREYNASHILLESEADALAVIETLNGGADFAEQAKERSTGPSGPNGGELGWFSTGAMVPEFETAVIALEPGEISAPVQTQFGWHVIKMNETRDKAKPTLEETRGELENQVRQTRLQARIDALRAAAAVEMATDGIPAAVIRDTTLLQD